MGQEHNDSSEQLAFLQNEPRRLSTKQSIRLVGAELPWEGW